MKDATRPGSLVIFEIDWPWAINVRLYLGPDAPFIPSLNVDMFRGTSGIVLGRSLSDGNVFRKAKAKVT
jgi:hypothetical protein